MSVCQQCNQNVPEGARFCPFCRWEVLPVAQLDVGLVSERSSVSSKRKKSMFFNNRSGVGMSGPMPGDSQQNKILIIIILGFIAVCIVAIICSDISYNAKMKAAIAVQTGTQ